jgi:hypothetical protein
MDDAGNHHRSRWTPDGERQADGIAEAQLERRPKHRHNRKSSRIGTRVGTRHLTNRCYGEGLAVTPSAQKANKTAFGGTIGQGEGLISSPFKTGALNRSATHPGCACYSVRAGGYISDRRHKYC